jgi:predicted transcriptional regulator
MPDPSDAELDILKLFWRHGPMSGREVQAHAGPELGWTDSTTRTVLERMRGKGLVTRKSVHGLAVYEAAQAKVDVLSGVLRKLRGILEIDGPLPATAFTGSQILNADELAELEAILDDDGGKS